MVMLFDLFNLPDDFYEILFATEQQQIVGKLLVQFVKENGGEITKTQMSVFATRLHDGKMVTKLESGPYAGKTVELSYNKRQFYDRILTPMKSMGLINYDLYKKTYSLSSRFKKALLEISLLWNRELEK
ncbi:MAG: hypothetical protein ACMXYK_01195 [Candidatus Woesearchaeota archaeon]